MIIMLGYILLLQSRYSSAMDRQSAIKQLNLLSIPCSLCHNAFPIYRMLIANNKNLQKSQCQKLKSSPIQRQLAVQQQGKTVQQIPKPDEIDKQALKNKHSPTPVDSLDFQQLPKQVQDETNVSANMIDTSIISDVKENDQISQTIPKQKCQKISSQIKFYCINCFVSLKMPLNSVDPQPLSEHTAKYLEQLPLPEYSVADQCLELLKQIQSNASAICKQILQSVDNFKFYVFKFVADNRKFFNHYIQSIKYYQTLPFYDWLLYKNMDKADENCQARFGKQLNIEYKRLQKIFSLDQDEYIIKMNKKFSELKKTKEKIASVKLNMPKFDESEPVKRKTVQICDIPITSLINFKGRKFYGAADGRILFESIDGLKNHKAHQSLIRSFAHNKQYTLYSGSDDFSIKAWDTRNNELKLIKTFGIIGETCKSYHRNICVINEGKTLISTRGQFDNFKIRLWDLQQQFNNIATLDGHQSFIRTMAVVDFQKGFIITSSDDKKIKIWDAKNYKLIKTLFRQKKINHLIVNQQLKLCAMIDEENRICIMDLTNYMICNSWTMPRKVLCCCKYTSTGLSRGKQDRDYLVLGMTINTSIWRWDGVKIWSIDTQASFTAVNIMQFSDTLVVSNGTGSTNQFNVGNIQHFQEQVMNRFNNQVTQQ